MSCLKKILIRASSEARKSLRSRDTKPGVEEGSKPGNTGSGIRLKAKRLMIDLL